MSSGGAEPRAAVTVKSEATRESILEGAKAAFAARGFAGTTIGEITERSRVSRAGFYYYFRDKRELFVELGSQTYLETVQAASSLAALPDPATFDDILGWVVDWFRYLDVHGAYLIRSAEDAPTDDDFRVAVSRLQRRAAVLLGAEVARRSTASLGDEGEIGLSLMALLERIWLLLQTAAYPADRDEMTAAVARVVGALLR